ncbi:hypothetical protein AB0N14_29225 [Streptomyces sp. NPDC051104]|uniref:hypothetical protein n=1 Tax=Streptomyces sp. NPDC051104 TaxID=3155044 RepID=UPI003420E948
MIRGSVSAGSSAGAARHAQQPRLRSRRGTVELTDPDALIRDLDARITASTLPTTEAHPEACNCLCSIIVCNTVVIC